MQTNTLQPGKAKWFLTLLLVLGWFAVIVQFYFYIGNAAASLPEMVIRFFSYFTILTNILVALSCTSLVFFANSKWGRHFGTVQTQTAITVYIVVVGLVYNTVLRFIWQPQGMQRVVDELLHLILPVLCLVYWLAYVRKNDLKWNDFWVWLVYPLVYLVVVMVRGWFSGYYPYPFLDLEKLQTSAVVLNCIGITLLFFLFSLLFIGIGKRQAKRIA
jgi:hypothetical protein